MWVWVGGWVGVREPVDNQDVNPPYKVVCVCLYFWVCVGGCMCVRACVREPADNQEVNPPYKVVCVCLYFWVCVCGCMCVRACVREPADNQEV